jgi:hypothetical protein
LDPLSLVTPNGLLCDESTYCTLLAAIETGVLMPFRILANALADSVVDDSRGGIPRREKNLTLTVNGLLGWLLVSAIGLLLYAVGGAWGSGSGIDITKRTIGVLGAASLLSLACLAMGSLIGFLFGIPRTVQSSEPGGTPGKRAGDATSRQEVNTNLEQISDWLTKILVGVGLTQLKDIPNELWRFANVFSPAMSAWASLAVILNFLIVGFFLGYLLTRLFLAGAFREADDTSITEQLATKAEQLERAGQFTSALAAFEGAIERLGPDASPAEKRRAFEGAVFNALYEPPPLGFQRAIEYAERYIREEPDTPSALIWAYLGFAYGQRFEYEQKRGNAAGAAEARTKALEAIKTALEINPSIRPLVASVWDPNSPMKSPGDDDLQVFYTDPAFRELLGTGNEGEP